MELSLGPNQCRPIGNTAEIIALNVARNRCTYPNPPNRKTHKARKFKEFSQITILIVGDPSNLDGIASLLATCGRDRSAKDVRKVRHQGAIAARPRLSQHRTAAMKRSSTEQRESRAQRIRRFEIEIK
jgi:hypothetical protein